MKTTLTVAELFAGVGGFRLGLEAANMATKEFQIVWANQWEPPGNDSKQFAWRCYESHFGKKSCVNEDIHEVLAKEAKGAFAIPSVDMVVGGFPCQDYSVARPLSQSQGIEGKKGILWWDIYTFLQRKAPRYVLLENVDRLLKSPASQRGRDFAVILSCFASLGYACEWRVINSGEYGFPQRRKRVFLFAEKTEEAQEIDLLNGGILAKAFPAHHLTNETSGEVGFDPYLASETFGKNCKISPFKTAGYMQKGCYVTGDYLPLYKGPQAHLQSVLVDAKDVPEQYWLSKKEIPRWQYLKGSKKEERVNKKTGKTYFYSEGAMAFPDNLDSPSRTILTGEGGSGPSRFKHVVVQNGRLRRLIPQELELLQTFPPGWTDSGMIDTQRAFCMGNALVVGVVEKIAKEILKKQ